MTNSFIKGDEDFCVQLKLSCPTKTFVEGKEILFLFHFRICFVFYMHVLLILIFFHLKKPLFLRTKHSLYERYLNC